MRAPSAHLPIRPCASLGLSKDGLSSYLAGDRDLGVADGCRSVRVSIALVLGTIAGGLLIRFGPLGLPRFVVKYGGSFLWSLVIYWVVSALLSRCRVLSVALLAGALTTSIEILKLYRSPWLDSFRLTVPGILLLGRFFSLWDILAYWFAMAIGAGLDRCFWRPR